MKRSPISTPDRRRSYRIRSQSRQSQEYRGCGGKYHWHSELDRPITTTRNGVSLLATSLRWRYVRNDEPSADPPHRLTTDSQTSRGQVVQRCLFNSPRFHRRSPAHPTRAARLRNLGTLCSDENVLREKDDEAAPATRPSLRRRSPH